MLIDEREQRENEALKTLVHAENVLRKRIKAMKDGAPKWAALERLEELKAAQKLILTGQVRYT